ncbi:permease prefix domain 1-containing protein [Microbacterium immunditiarum]|uniref:MFS family permease n=1 Tax=Microbacterium immunditiarum TaxID=337480 RepID=A0A7Y9GTC8_9MICO|nr:permease prefix domain 1-containing protein [Microbacterium immunditiarum]NYE21245.1 MFS family permease [Microbacterium immunditiarum]
MTENLHIHRLLDEAFAGVELTPDTQDLKEEIRANLMARAAELEESGVAPDEAARRAVAELGDVRELVGETAPAGVADAAAPRRSWEDLMRRHHVKPKPGFVVRAVVWSVAAVVGITLGILGATGVLPLALGAQIGLFGLASTGIALLVGDSLSQETTMNHPMPQNRAAGYFLATLLGAFGLAFAGLVALGSMPMWGIVFAALGVVASIILFAFLLASQTNRHKAWTRQMVASEPPNRFEREPETAARFGIYTAVIWIVTFGVIVALIFTVGWWWTPLAFIGGFALMMLVLARMLFAPDKR